MLKIQAALGSKSTTLRIKQNETQMKGRIKCMGKKEGWNEFQIYMKTHLELTLSTKSWIKRPESIRNPYQSSLKEQRSKPKDLLVGTTQSSLENPQINPLAIFTQKSLRSYQLRTETQSLMQRSRRFQEALKHLNSHQRRTQLTILDHLIN